MEQQQQQEQGFKNLTGELKEFYEFHGVQLIAWQFPTKIELLKVLFEKLKSKIFDAGKQFQIMENEEEEAFQAKATIDIKAESDVYLIDHAVSFRYEQLRPQLENDPKLLERLANMTKYCKNKKKIPGLTPQPKQYKCIVEHDYQEIKDPNIKKVPLATEVLSLYGNEITEMELVRQQLQKLPDLKVLWLNDNPICEQQADFSKKIEEEYQSIEILNSKFTQNISAFAIKFVTFGVKHYEKVLEVNAKDMKYIDLSDRDALKVAKLAKLLEQEFQNVVDLNLKETEIENLEDTNSFFAILKALKQLVNIQVDQKVEEILLDLYKQNKLKEICPSLKYVNGHDLAIQVPPHPQEEQIREVMKNIWQLAGCYRLASSEQYDESAIWYINDEFGSAVQHADKGNVKIVPFLYAPNNKMDGSVISYSLCWAVQDILAGEDLTRDLLVGIDEKAQRSSKLFAWFDLPLDFFHKQFQLIEEMREKKSKEGLQILKEFRQKPKQKVTSQHASQNKLKVLTDIQVIIENLKDPKFEFVQELEKADVIWLNASVQETFDKLAKTQMINQFPFESCIVMKHNLNHTVSSTLGNVPWMQRTYDLNTELPIFIGDYLQRKEKYLDNIWIVKPPNMARSMDMVVTDNIDIIIRMLESGPKLVQKYIERPVTIKNKKIDLRFIVTLKSLDPLEVFVYKRFWVRTGNNQFTNDYRTREVYETHFTVMNYGKKLEQIHDTQFKEMFDQEYGAQVKWEVVEKRIYNMITECFVSTQKAFPQMSNPQSRAIYGLDVMVDQNGFIPKMLELTFSPDCNRACKFDPTFFDDIFGLLFLDRSENDTNHIRIV